MMTLNGTNIYPNDPTLGGQREGSYYHLLVVISTYYRLLVPDLSCIIPQLY
jgi:hypothetical protein